MSISTKQFLAKFQREVKGLGGSTEAAKHFKVTKAFINNVLTGRELPSKKILEPMGLIAKKNIKYRYEESE